MNSNDSNIQIFSFLATDVVTLMAKALHGESFYSTYAHWVNGLPPEESPKEPALWLVFDEEVFLMSNTGHEMRVKPLKLMSCADNDDILAITVHAGALLEMMKISHKFVDFEMSEDGVKVSGSQGWDAVHYSFH